MSAVVVPLDVVDLVLVQHGQHGVPHVGVAGGDPEIDHLLVTRGDRRTTAGAHHPFGVGARDVGVEVDHLRLEPQPELHAELLDPVHQRVQPPRPGVGRDRPVAEAGEVVASGAEPGVVEPGPIGGGPDAKGIAD